MAVTESIGKGESISKSNNIPTGSRTLPSGFTLDNGLKGNGHAKYVIEKVLGDGGFGIVYKAKARMRSKNGRALSWTSFAIKEFFHRNCDRSETYSLIDKSEASFKEAKMRFKKEAEKLHELEIPNVVEVNECFECNNTVYYVMQFVEGQNLQEYVAGKDDDDGCGAMSEVEALSIMTPVIEAVEKLHDNRLLHLDIKPNNIMLGKEGGEHDKYASIGNNRYAPILIDFGTASSSKFNKKVDVKYRTQGYSSPEQSYPDIFGYKNDFDRRLDVFALGATMYFLLTGVMPIDAPSRKEDFEDFIDQITTQLKEKNVSEKICDAVVKAMNPYRSKRTASAREFLNELGAADELEAELLAKIKKRNRNALILLLVVIIVGIGAVFTWDQIVDENENINRLKIAIEQHDKAILTEYAELDSLSAIKELINVHECDSNYLMAWYWSQYVNERKDAMPGGKADLDSIITRTEMFRQKAVAKVDTTSSDFKNMVKLLGLNPSDLFKSTTTDKSVEEKVEEKIDTPTPIETPTETVVETNKNVAEDLKKTEKEQPSQSQKPIEQPKEVKKVDEVESKPQIKEKKEEKTPKTAFDEAKEKGNSAIYSLANEGNPYAIEYAKELLKKGQIEGARQSAWKFFQRNYYSFDEGQRTAIERFFKVQ